MAESSELISFELARQCVLDHCKPLPVQSLPLADAAGLHLAHDIAAPFDLPPFTSSAMDGFGVRVSDVESASPAAPVTLRITETIFAGQRPTTPLSPGWAVKIMTGALVPPGVEAVVMREFTSEEAGSVLIRRPTTKGESIRPAGEEFRAGQVILRAGQRATPAALGLLATIGHSLVDVRMPPTVAVLVTGDELAPSGQALAVGQRYDSNSVSLLTACRAEAISDVCVEHVPDDRDALVSAFRRWQDRCDVLLTVGGVSAGDRDYVPRALQECGATIHFHRAAIKPGKPILFATLQRDRDRVLSFGLPGNPVSALLTFHLFVKPALRRMMGAERVLPLTLGAALATSLHKEVGRLEFVRAVLHNENGENTVHPLAGRESHMLGALASANCLIHFQAEAERLPAGSCVTVELLD